MVSRMPRSSGSSCAVKLNSLSSRPLTCSTSGTCRWRRMEYAEKFSVTSQKLVLSVGLRPAPLTPLLASQTMPRRGRSRRLRAAAGSPGWPPSDSSRGWTPAARRGSLAVELGQAVGRLASSSGWCGFPCTRPVVRRRAQAESAAEVDHARAGLQHGRRQFHRNLRRCGQEDHCDAFGVNHLGIAGQAFRRLGMEDRRAPVRTPRDAPADRFPRPGGAPECEPVPRRCSRGNRQCRL
jgi:hypothetical protein